MRMNPYIFQDSRVGEDPQEFLDGVNKIVSAMEYILGRKHSGILIIEGGFSSIVHSIRDNRPVRASSIEWEYFKKALLGSTFPVRRENFRLSSS